MFFNPVNGKCQINSINRRDFLKALGLGAATLTVPPGCSKSSHPNVDSSNLQSSTDKPPNIIIILAIKLHATTKFIITANRFAIIIIIFNIFYITLMHF